VYVIYAGLILGVFVMWLMGRATLRHIGIIKLVPYSVIVPVVLVLCYVGAFSLTGSIIDANIAFGLGLIGYFMKKNGFLTSPAVIGFVLGAMIEENFRRAVLQGYGGYSLIFGRPIALTILIIATAAFVWALWTEHKTNKMAAEAGNSSH
jgi:putative tricarboxylic transport membrane protein